MIKLLQQQMRGGIGDGSSLPVRAIRQRAAVLR